MSPNLTQRYCPTAFSVTCFTNLAPMIHYCSQQKSQDSSHKAAFFLYKILQKYYHNKSKNKFPRSITVHLGHAVAQLVEALCYKPEGRGFDSRWCHWIFSLTQSFRTHYGPGVDSASNRNKYQECFLGVKAAGA